MTEQCGIWPAALLVLGIALGLALTSGCQDTSQEYVVVHADGRVWRLPSEPYIGGKHGLCGWGTRAICWRNPERFRCAVLPENAQVMPLAEFDMSTAAGHYWTTERVWEGN